MWENSYSHRAKKLKSLLHLLMKPWIFMTQLERIFLVKKDRWDSSPESSFPLRDSLSAPHWPLYTGPGDTKPVSPWRLLPWRSGSAETGWNSDPHHDKSLVRQTQKHRNQGSHTWLSSPHPLWIHKNGPTAFLLPRFPDHLSPPHTSHGGYFTGPSSAGLPPHKHRPTCWYWRRLSPAFLGPFAAQAMIRSKPAHQAPPSSPLTSHLVPREWPVAWSPLPIRWHNDLLWF